MIAEATMKMGTVSLRVQDLAKMRDFYVRIVGLQVRQETADMVALGTATNTLVQLQQVSHGRYMPHTPGLYHLALRVPDRQNLAHWLRHYATYNAPNWQGASDHGVSAALYLADPEGNGLEIYHDHPRQRWLTDKQGQIIAFAHRLDLDALIQDAPHQPWRGLPSSTDMGHIHLQVNDLAAARVFYVDLLGFEVKTAHQNSALFVAAGDYHHHLGLNTWQSQGQANRSAEAYGLDDFVVWVSHTAVYNTLCTKLKQAHYPHHTTPTTIYLQDPAGNTLRLAQKPDPITN